MKLNRNVILIFLSGCAAGSIIQWAFIYKWPLLSSDRAKGSYAIGYHLGQNFTRQKINVEPRIFAAAMNDAKNENARLGDEERQKGADFIQKEGAALRQAEISKQAAKTSVTARSRDGFIRHAEEFEYRLGDWESYTKGKDLVHLNPQDHAQQIKEERYPQQARPLNSKVPVEFTIAIYDASGKRIYDSTKKNKSYTLTARELPRLLKRAMGLVEPHNSILIRTHRDLHWAQQLEIPFAFNPSMTVEIKRLR